MIRRVILGALLALAAALPAFAAPNFPALSGRVVDAANIIPPAEEAALDAKLKMLEDNSTRQLVVTTIADLQGYDIADYGYQLGRAWGIGQKSENNGALLIVAPNERRVRIEAGYGLEPILTDAFAGVVINSRIVPRFKAGDFPGGILAGTDALIEQLQLPPEEAAKRAAAVRRPARSDQGMDAQTVIWLAILVIFFVLPLLRGLFGGRGRKRRFGRAPVILWGGGGGGWGGGGSSWGGGGGFSGGGGSFGGGGASGGW